MPRTMRAKSKSGYYHVMIRGNERKDIFLDENDKLRFIKTVYRMKEDKRFHIHAFCIMDNHVHMIIKEDEEDISKTMKRINVSYVSYFNKKYNRIGHLFQDRFKSEIIMQDSYVLMLLRYIHQNPVKAGMVKEPGEYKWSSYNGYLGHKSIIYEGLNTELILEMFSKHRQEAKKLFVQYMNEEGKDIFLDIEESKQAMNDKRAQQLYKNMLSQIGLTSDNLKVSQIPVELLIKYKNETNFSIRKMSAIMGVNKDVLSRILRKSIQ